MGTASTRDSLLDLLAPVVAASGLELEDVQITPAGRRRLLRVVVDGDGGVGLDAVAGVSTAVSAKLDETDAMGGAPYVLEVTSPGVDRPLTEPRHWRRASGHLVTASLSDGSTVKGRLRAADDAGVVLDADAGPERLAWDTLVSGRVEVEFNRPAPKDGGEA